MELKIENSKLKIAFMGTPEFGAIILEGLVKNDYKPILVVTTPNKPVGRKQILTPLPVKVIAEENKIPVLHPEKILEAESEIKNSKPDLIITAAFGQILPNEILEIPKYGCLNVHPSLLPRYRGPSPIQAVILNDDKETGVTIFLMDEKIDHGKIISTSKYQVPNKITSQELSKELAKMGVKLLIETIPKWIEGKISPKAQDDSKATFTKIIKKEDGKISWKKSAEEIERQIRAFYPWPGSFTFWQRDDKKIRLKILKAETLKLEKTEVGKVYLDAKNNLCVQSGKDCLIIEKLQFEGKKPINSDEFLRGNSDFIDAVL